MGQIEIKPCPFCGNKRLRVYNDDKQRYAISCEKCGYDASVEKLAKLVDKKKELESKEILELLKTTTLSFEEIKEFLKGENSEEENN